MMSPQPEIAEVEAAALAAGWTRSDYQPNTWLSPKRDYEVRRAVHTDYLYDALFSTR